MKIKTLYLVTHAHTDIGFTDYQDVVLRQHMEFIDRALDLCEETTDYPDEAKFKWVCEATGITEQYLQSRSAGQVDRFLRLHRTGQIDVTAMQYNLTPLLPMEPMLRSLYPVERLRRTYGLTIETAMNCDVNGASWIFADALSALGIGMFTMAVNPVRGMFPRPHPGGFWWIGPGGGRVLAWNGYHYLFGGLAGVGDMELAKRLLPGIVERLEADASYPFDFIYGQTTNPTRVDNGPPDERLSRFIREWNERGESPRIELTTVSAFHRMLRTRFADTLGERGGDWLDWWADGVASSAFETGVYRSIQPLLSSAEAMAAWLTSNGHHDWSPKLANQIYEYATLFAEHTWGSFASVEDPDGLLARSQWNRKSYYVYRAAAEAHDLLARTGRAFGGRLGAVQPEIHFDLNHLPPEIANPPSRCQELLVINTLPFNREVTVEDPIRRGGQAPAGMLEMFLPRNLTWGVRSDPEPRVAKGMVPGFGYAFLPLADRDEMAPDLRVGPDYIENEYYRVRIDPHTGGLAQWYDKRLNRDFAGTYRGWRIGQYVHERVESPRQRDAIFQMDWSRDDFGIRPLDTPFRQATVERVVVEPPRQSPSEVSVTVQIEGPGVRQAHCTFRLIAGKRTLAVDWTLEKEHVTEPEAVMIAFPFALGAPRFRADINGVAITPDEEQLPGTVRDWYPVQQWVSVYDGQYGVVLRPADAPLVFLGGVTTGKWADKLVPEASCLMSWALNNHWMVNFKASQGGRIPLRYELTTYAGEQDDADCYRWSAELATAPIVLRDFERFASDPQTDRWLTIDPDDKISVLAKPAEDGRGVIIRLQNITPRDELVTLAWQGAHPKRVRRASIVERDEEDLEGVAGAYTLDVPGRSIRTVRAEF